MTQDTVYSASITAGSLLIHESKKIASILMTGLSPGEVMKQVAQENLLQKRSPRSSRKQCSLILNRLTSMQPDILKLICEGDYLLSVQSLLACSVKHSRLLGDFMLRVIGSRVRIIDDRLSNRDWEKFLESCELEYPHLRRFTDSTRKKLRQVIFRILVESKYLESQKTLRLTPVHVAPELKSYLSINKEKYVLKCLEVYK